MSLIPSESYSFPDHFTTTVAPSRKPKQPKAEARVEKPRPKPTIVALPNPEPEPEPQIEMAAPEIISEESFVEPIGPEIEAVEPPFEPPFEPPAPVIEPARSQPPRPNPALRRAQASPPRIPEAPTRVALPTLKPKVRWNNRAPAMDPAPNPNNGNGNGVPPAPVPQAQNVIPIQQPVPVKPPNVQSRPAPPPAVVARPKPQPHPVQRPAPKPAPVAPQMRQPRPPAAPPKAQPARVSNSQADFFEVFADDGYGVAMKRRRDMKFRRFVACEAAALAVLLPLVILGLTLDVSAPALRWTMNIFTIAAAIAAAVIPIAFYAVTPTLPELER